MQVSKMPSDFPEIEPQCTLRALLLSSPLQWSTCEKPHPMWRKAPQCQRSAGKHLRPNRLGWGPGRQTPCHHSPAPSTETGSTSPSRCATSPGVWPLLTLRAGKEGQGSPHLSRVLAAELRGLCLCSPNTQQFPEKSLKGPSWDNPLFKPGRPPSLPPSFFLSFILMTNLCAELWFWEELKNWSRDPKCLPWVCHC